MSRPGAYRVRRNRRGWIFAAAALAVVLASLLYLQMKRVPETPLGPAFVWAEADGSDASPRYELPVRRVVNGMTDVGVGPVPEIDGTESTAFLVIDLDFIDAYAWYELAVFDFGDDEMWRSRIPESSLSAKGLVLRVDPRALPAGRYHLEIIEIEDDGFSDVVAESLFDVTHR